MVLIFEDNISGHHLEYLYHVFCGALLRKDENFVFVVPEDFNEVKYLFKWEVASNIKFYFFSPKYNKNRSVLKSSYNRCVILKKMILKFNPEIIFLPVLMPFIPFLPFFIPKHVKVRGIIYSIYLYKWENSSLKWKVFNYLKYRIISSAKSIDKVFILNDKSSVAVLNKIWKTNKYIYLVDPYIPIDKSLVKNLRSELRAENRTIILHPGVLSRRKGTLELFKMIENTNKLLLDNYCIVFAGKLSDDILDEFNSSMGKYKEKIQIIFKEGFLSYEYLCSLILSADKVVLPYIEPGMSSGIIGYCAQFNVCVYVYNRGLLAKLVKRYKIGLAMDNFESLDGLPYKKIDSNYCRTHKVDDFVNTIIY